VETAIGIAVPVFGAEGLVKGSLSITYPEGRMDEAHNRTLIVLLQDGAGALSTALGWDGKSGNPYRPQA